MTIMRDRVWSEEILLWSDAVKKSPDFALGHMNLGLNFQDRGDLGNAAVSYEKPSSMIPLIRKSIITWVLFIKEWDVPIRL